MWVIVTTPELGLLLHRYGDAAHIPGNESYLALQQWLTQQNCTLEPTFPHTTEESLQTYFKLTPTTALAPEAVDQLLTLPGIDGAYEKPLDELPG